MLADLVVAIATVALTMTYSILGCFKVNLLRQREKKHEVVRLRQACARHHLSSLGDVLPLQPWNDSPGYTPGHGTEINATVAATAAAVG